MLVQARFALITLLSVSYPPNTYVLVWPSSFCKSPHMTMVSATWVIQRKASGSALVLYFPELWETLELICLALRFARACFPHGSITQPVLFLASRVACFRAAYSDSIPVHYFKWNSCDFFFSSGESIPLISVLKSENFPSHLIIQTQQPRNISNCHLYFTKHFVFNIF